MMFRQRKHSAMSPYEDRKRFQNSSPKLQFWRRVFKTQLQNCSFGDEFCKTRRNFFLMAFLKTRHQNCSFADEFWKLNYETAVLPTSFENATPKLQFWRRVFKTQLQNCSFGDEFFKTRLHFFWWVARDPTSQPMLWGHVLRFCTCGDRVATHQVPFST